MPFVERNQAGKIVGVYPIAQIGITEELPDDNAEIVTFRTPKVSLKDQLKAILTTLSPEVQAQFGEVAAAIELAIENGEPNVASLELQALTLPADLEPVRAQMLAVINAV
jgi:hypothetical protein